MSIIKEEIDSAIHNVLGHGQYIMGPEVFSLEEKLSNFCEIFKVYERNNFKLHYEKNSLYFMFISIMNILTLN